MTTSEDFASVTGQFRHELLARRAGSPRDA
jgi:hypothetical protein